MIFWKENLNGKIMSQTLLAVGQTQLLYHSENKQSVVDKAKNTMLSSADMNI